MSWEMRLPQATDYKEEDFNLPMLSSLVLGFLLDCPYLGIQSWPFSSDTCSSAWNAFFCILTMLKSRSPFLIVKLKCPSFQSPFHPYYHEEDLLPPNVQSTFSVLFWVTNHFITWYFFCTHVPFLSTFRSLKARVAHTLNLPQNSLAEDHKDKCFAGK
jgi:hypothetical protein